MIYTERTVRITNGVANIDAPILLYRGDRQVEILFEIMDSKFKFSSEKGNYIKNVEASFGQLAIDCPDGRDVFTEVAPCIDGAVTFTITGEMIDELYEVGFYSFHIRLFNNDQSSRITIPPIMKGIEIREPIVIEGDDYGEVAMVNYGKVDEAIIEDEQATFLDENGNLNIEWKKGDIISSLRLNQMVGYINENAVPGEQGPQGPKGDTGEQGIQGEKGDDGLTTSIIVNGQTFTHENGVITLPDYPQAGTSADTYSRDEVDDIVYDYSGGKKQRYVTQDEYDNLSEDELNDGTIVWNITDAEEVSIPADLTINDNNLLQLKDANGNAIGTGVTVSTASIPSNELILTSASGYKFKVIVNDEGVLSTEEIITLGNIIASVNELSINEGESATFTIALSEKPSRPQTITITSNNTDVTVNPSSIDISDTNPHTITVTASEDEDYDNDSAILTLSSDNVSNVTINISIKDNDIKPQPCTGISFDKTSLSLKQNNTYKLTATVTPEGCTDEIVWSTSNSNCTVVDGLVTATTIGDCIITATCGNYSATCSVTVSEYNANAQLVTTGLMANLDSFDAVARTMNDSVGSYNLTGISEDVTINDNYLYVPSGSGNKSAALNMNLSKIGTLTFSYVVDVTDWTKTKQFISGNHSESFYLWVDGTQINTYYRNISIFSADHYTAVVTDNPRFIDVVINQTNGTAELYVNGELKTSRTGLNLSKPINTNLYLNHNGGNASQGDFKLYSFKVYNKCLTSDEIIQNMNYESNRLGL